MEKYLNAGKKDRIQYGEDFNIVHNRAGFGGDQLTLAAALLNGANIARDQGTQFKGIGAVLQVPNYWRVEKEYFRSKNLEKHPVVADAFLNLNHAEFVRQIENNNAAVVYVDNPTNPQGRKHNEQSMNEILDAAKE